MGLGWVIPGGGGGITSVNGDTGPAVVLTAGDVGALALSGGTMSGNIAMGGNDITGASSVNGVALTAGGSGNSFLAADGSYGVPVANLERTSRLTTLDSTGPTPITYLQLTTGVVTAGDYIVFATVTIGGTSQGTSIESNLLVDGAPFTGPLMQTSVAGGRLLFSGTSTVSWTEAVHTVTLEFGQPSSPGLAQAHYAFIIAMRIA